MFKRKKDGGFTLIELMIVIAVIGILAIVLVPKVGSIKTQAKATGVETNMRVVQGFVESKIDTWVNQKNPATGTNGVDAIIDAAFTGSENHLTNPYTSSATDAVTGADVSPVNVPLYILNTTDGDDIGTLSDTATKGTIVVSIKEVSGIVSEITIYAHDNKGLLLKEVTVTP